MCKVLIADDSEVMRTAIRKMLQEESSIDVVGEASSFAEIADLKPDESAQSLSSAFVHQAFLHRLIHSN
jgi:DNA-binding NarL/FixJ family response regulator